jgi:hypothetical protein
VVSVPEPLGSAEKQVVRFLVIGVAGVRAAVLEEEVEMISVALALEVGPAVVDSVHDLAVREIESCVGCVSGLVEGDLVVVVVLRDQMGVGTREQSSIPECAGAVGFAVDLVVVVVVVVVVDDDAAVAVVHVVEVAVVTETVIVDGTGLAAVEMGPVAVEVVLGADEKVLDVDEVVLDAAEEVLDAAEECLVGEAALGVVGEVEGLDDMMVGPVADAEEGGLAADIEESRLAAAVYGVPAEIAMEGPVAADGRAPGQAVSAAIVPMANRIQVCTAAGRQSQAVGGKAAKVCSDGKTCFVPCGFPARP